MTAALLALGINYHYDLQETVTNAIWAFAGACTRTTESIVAPQAGDLEYPPLEDAVRTATVAVALLGFMDAASAQADFWKAGGRLALVQKVRQILSEPFLVAVETSLSIIRNSHAQDREVKEWKRYLRHYSSVGRPLGANLLQRSFMWLLVSSTSLMTTEVSQLRKTHILDFYMSQTGKLQTALQPPMDADIHSIDTYASLVMEQMNYLEAGADFVRLGPSSQQRLAFEVKAAAITSYLNICLLNEETGDPEVLFSWLQETLEDPMQMADDILSSTVLRCLALICQIAPSFASAVSRLLPKFLVQMAPQGELVAVASTSLAYVLKMLSKDAVISTLYMLGNVLSPRSEAPFANGHANGGPDREIGPTTLYAGRQSTGSAISFQMTNEEEAAIIYQNVVRAICGIAAAFQDEKITALAQSMLLQKLDEGDTQFDSQIITGAAALALKGGPLEFRSLLKLYSRMCHAGVVNNKTTLLASVSWASRYPKSPTNLLRCSKHARISRPTCVATRTCSKSIGSTSWTASSPLATSLPRITPRKRTCSLLRGRLERCCTPSQSSWRAMISFQSRS